MLKLDNVSKFYTNEGSVALGLKSVSLALEKNEFVAIIGESGSGKSTLLNVIGGIDSYENGEMYVSGVPTSGYSDKEWDEYRKKKVGFIFQNYNLIDSYSVKENIESTLLLYGMSLNDAKIRTKSVIEQVGLTKASKTKASKLSGGEKQRVAIAKALAIDPDILLCDEPTGNLDSVNSQEIMKLIYSVSKNKLVIIVTHDYSLVKDYATRKIRMVDGMVEEDVIYATKPYQDQKETKLLSTHRFSYLLVGFKNLLFTPKKTILSAFVFAMLTLLLLVTQVSVSGQSSGSNYYSNFTYQNKDPKRIAINKIDKQAFTTDEIDMLKSLVDVDVLIEEDYILDNQLSLFNGNFYETTYYQSLETIKDKTLDLGEMPKNDNEVVLAINEIYANNYYNQEVEFIRYNDYSNAKSKSAKYKVTGLIYEEDYYSRYVYGNDNFALMLREMFAGQYYRFALYSPSNSLNYSIPIQIDDTLSDNQAIINMNPMYYSFLQLKQADDIVVKYGSYYHEGTIDNLTIDIKEIDEFTAFLTINRNNLKKIITANTYQVSLFAKNENKVESLVSLMRKNNYRVYLPSKTKFFDMNYYITLFMNIFNSVMAIGGFIILYYVTGIVLSFIIKSKKKDYVIFRIFGTNQKQLNNMVILENLVLATGGFIVGAIVVVLINHYVKPLIFPAPNFFLTYVLLLLIALLVSIRFNSRIFNISVNKALNQD